MRLRGIGQALAEIREKWGWSAEVLAIVLVVATIYCVLKAPEWVEEWRWRRIESDIRERLKRDA